MEGRVDAATGSTDTDGDIGQRRTEIARRVEIVRDLVRSRGASAALLLARRNVAWATLGAANHVVVGDTMGAVGLFVTAGGVVALSPVNEAARFRDEEIAGLEIGLDAIPWYEDLTSAARSRAGGELLVDADLEGSLRPIRSVLGPLEQARVTWLGRQVREAMDTATALATPGLTEDAACVPLIGKLATAGVRTPVVLAAADERIGNYRHPLPTATIIRERLMLIVVAERWGLHAALTSIRDFVEPPTWIAERMALVAEVEAAMLAATRPAATLNDVLDATRRAYGNAGYPDEWQLHHQGGSIAYQPREEIATPGSRTRIEAGMAFAWNPSITGAKTERTVLVGSDGSLRSITDPAASPS